MTTKNAIEAAKITKKLKNFTLDVENFAIPQGFATALIGENGAGKTTLLNILAGIRLDYKGDITYFGQYSDKQKENSGDIKNRIGYTGPGTERDSFVWLCSWCLSGSVLYNRSPHRKAGFPDP